jgi:hypothetical protein
MRPRELFEFVTTTEVCGFVCALRQLSTHLWWMLCCAGGVQIKEGKEDDYLEKVQEKIAAREATPQYARLRLCI